ncbi:MAG: hypothetical protein HZA90_07520 [Verrucomicrobia bacterium]|nr:hypothetical protein [Verrucomicrobiota bacterium]
MKHRLIITALALGVSALGALAQEEPAASSRDEATPLRDRPRLERRRERADLDQVPARDAERPGGRALDRDTRKPQAGPPLRDTEAIGPRKGRCPACGCECGLGRGQGRGPMNFGRGGGRGPGFGPPAWQQRGGRDFQAEAPRPRLGPPPGRGGRGWDVEPQGDRPLPPRGRSAARDRGE